MEKFLMQEIPENTQVVLNVPEGRLRVGGSVDTEAGEGALIFGIADEEAKQGSRHAPGNDTQAVRIIIQDPDRLRTIARACEELAERMEALLYEEDDGDDEGCSDCSGCCGCGFMFGGGCE